MTLLLTYYLFLLYEYVTKISILSLYLTKLYRYVTLSFASVISHILYSEIRQNFANSARWVALDLRNGPRVFWKWFIA